MSLGAEQVLALWIHACTRTFTHTYTHTHTKKVYIQDEYAPLPFR